jgi:hypothetical protein
MNSRITSRWCHGCHCSLQASSLIDRDVSLGNLKKNLERAAYGRSVRSQGAARAVTGYCEDPKRRMPRHDFFRGSLTAAYGHTRGHGPSLREALQKWLRRPLAALR